MPSISSMFFFFTSTFESPSKMLLTESSDYFLRSYHGW
jgi:hypothetical protein